MAEILSFLVVLVTSFIEPLSLLLAVGIGLGLTLISKTKLLWLLVIVGGIGLYIALHLPFGFRSGISLTAITAKVMQVAFGAWLGRKWKRRSVQI
jgi:hypothetical protein